MNTSLSGSGSGSHPPSLRQVGGRRRFALVHSVAAAAAVGKIGFRPAREFRFSAVCFLFHATKLGAERKLARAGTTIVLSSSLILTRKPAYVLEVAN